MRTILLLVPLASACTNFIVTKGASLEGHNSFAYTDDGGNNYGEITLLPAADHPAGSTRKIWRWEDGKYLGEIPEAAHTYHVVGNMNEHQLAIGETTFTGRTELRNPMEIAKMDYANLMSISLQRAKTAREAIDLMDQLTKDFGYASTGESLTISDPAEVWHMEIVGRGQEKGAAWVARRVPDGYIGGHANQARITTFPLDEPETTKYSVDLISWARRAGYFAADGPDEAFDFSAAFNPISFHGSRYGEVRVWDFFRRAVDGFAERHEQYARGFDLQTRMPLWVRPDRPVALNDTFWWMRSHFEGTPFDMTQGVGSGPYGAAYRARPTAWSVDGKEYVNERPVATQQTGWHFVAVMRDTLPAAVGGVSWYGVDDTSHSSRIPVYAGSTAVPAGWTRTPLSGEMARHSTTSSYWTAGTSDEFHFHFASAFWVHNLVANLCYGRWTAHADVTAEIAAAEGEALAQSVALEASAAALLRAGREAEAREMLTDFTVRAGQRLVARWHELWLRLTVKYRDGFVVSQNASRPNGDLASTNASEVGYPAVWYARMAADDGHHLAAPPMPTVAAVALTAAATSSFSVGDGLSALECARAVCPPHTVTTTAEQRQQRQQQQQWQQQPTWATSAAPSAGAVSVGMLLSAMVVSAAVGALASGLLVRAAARLRGAEKAPARAEAAWPLAESSTRTNDYHAFA